MRIVLTDQVFPTVDREEHAFAAAGHEFVVARNPGEAKELIHEADAILNTYMPLPAETIAGLQRAQIIARYGIGVDNIDLVAARSQGIVVTNVPDYCVEEVATHAIAMTLSMLRGLPAADADLRSGGWGTEAIRPLRRISSLSIGLLGLGRIGTLVAEMMRAFTPSIHAYDPYSTHTPEHVRMHESVDDLLASSDVVLLHAPLTPETRNIISNHSIASMRDGAYLVNVARGPLIDLNAVIANLESGKLRGVALDTFPQEPLPAPETLATVPGLYMTPHVAYYSEESLRESQDKAIAQVLSVLGGGSAQYQVN